MIIEILKEIKDIPNEFQLLPYGRIDIEGEPPAYVDEESIASVISHFTRRGNDMVIDYEHQTLKDVQAPAAGWIKRLVDRGKDGLWAVVEWTERAREYLKNKEYRYFSPVFWVTKEGRKVARIENVALTNFPKINQLRPIVAKLSREEARAAQRERSRRYGIGIKEGGHVTKPSEWADVPDDEWLDPVNYRYPCPDAEQTKAAASYWGQKDNQRQYTPEERAIINARLDKFREKFSIGKFRKEEAKMITKIRKLLGLPDEAGEDKVVEAVEAVVAKNKELEGTQIVACKEVLEAIGASEKDGKEEVVAKVTELREAGKKKTDLEQELIALKKDHEELKQKWDEKNADELVAKALTKGQITPAQVEEYGRDMAMKDPEKFKKVVLSRREFSEVPLKEMPDQGPDQGGGTPAEKMDRLIAKKLKENKDMSYADAMNLVVAENPELAEEYIKSSR